MAWYNAPWAYMKAMSPIGIATGYTGRAISNITNRGKQMAQQGGSFGDVAKYAFKPQTAYAAESMGNWPQYTGQTAGVKTTTSTGTPTDTGGGGGYNTGGGSSTAPFEQVYRGKLYTNADEYKAAVQADALEEYNRQKGAIDRMYDEGLLSFEDRMTQLSKARDTASQNVQGFFGAIAPGVESSQETNFTNDVMAQYGQGADRLGREKESFSANVLDQIAALQNAYESQQDELGQGLLDYTKNVKPINLPSEEEQMKSFGRFDYTNKVYGGAQKKTPAVKSGKPFQFTTPIGTFLYSDGQVTQVA